METLHITKTNFLNWWFNTGSDQEQKENHLDLGKRAVEMLLSGEDFFYSVEDAFNECEISCIPIMYTEEYRKDGYDELEIGDLEGVFDVVLID